MVRAPEAKQLVIACLAIELVHRCIAGEFVRCTRTYGIEYRGRGGIKAQVQVFDLAEGNAVGQAADHIAERGRRPGRGNGIKRGVDIGTQ
ncbi:hypothetical protein D3C78_1498980 [compost metagenome]